VLKNNPGQYFCLKISNFDHFYDPGIIMKLGNYILNLRSHTFVSFKKFFNMCVLDANASESFLINTIFKFKTKVKECQTFSISK
jgi:hypothetical protein